MNRIALVCCVLSFVLQDYAFYQVYNRPPIVNTNVAGKSVKTTTDETGRIVKRTVIADKDRDGEIDLRVTSITVGGRQVLIDSWESRSNIRTRDYGTDCPVFVFEYDKDNDGIFEMSIVYDQDYELLVILKFQGVDVFFADEDETRELRKLLSESPGMRTLKKRGTAKDDS